MKSLKLPIDEIDYSRRIVIIRFQNMPYFSLFRYNKKWMQKVDKGLAVETNEPISLELKEIPVHKLRLVSQYALVATQTKHFFPEDGRFVVEYL